MININIKKILEITNGKLLNGNINEVCNKIEIDSRKVDEKIFFMPILGEIQDGHIFILNAFENNAQYSFCETSYYKVNKDKLNDKNLILVDNTTDVLHLLTKYILKKCNVKTVGITGSLGKTSTKEMISHILKEKYNVHSNKGNFNNHIGLPLTVFELKEEHDIAVLEMGMNHFKEIEKLVDIVRPDIGVITNIGTSHIGILGSQDAIFKAKMEMVTYFNKDNTLILNADDKYLITVKSEIYKIISVGSKEKFFLNAYDLNIKDDGCYIYKLNYLNKTYDVELNVLGKHNVINSLLALAVGLELSMSIETAIKGLYKFKNNKKRLEIINIYNNNIIINDCYNASSESMISAIDVLEKFKGKRKIAVLGDVLELGNFSEENHRKVGNYISKTDFDYIYTLGEASNFIKLAAIENGFNKDKIYSFTDKKILIESLINLVDFKDIILIKGSLGMGMMEIVEALKARR